MVLKLDITKFKNPTDYRFSDFGDIRGPLGPLFAPVNKEKLTFPEELQQIDHWVTFTAIETSQAIRTESSKRKAMASIVLPLPAGLQTAYNIQYSELALGALGREFMDALGGDSGAKELLTSSAKAAATGAGAGVAVAAITGGNFFGKALSGAAAGIVTEAALSAGKGESAAAAGLLSTLMGEDKMAAAAASQFGVARNPHKVVLFDSVGFRTHSFSYQFTPKNRKESETLNQIIKLFKYHASPGMNPTGTIKMDSINKILPDNAKLADITLSGGKHFFRYPEFFKIEFHHPEFLFKIGESVLKTVDVNYHGGGSMSYARDTADTKPAPTQVNLSLSFQETDIITKENIDEGR